MSDEITQEEFDEALEEILSKAMHQALEGMEGIDDPICDRCLSEIGVTAVEKGWPIDVAPRDHPEDYPQETESVCPDCYGCGGHCSEGHVLPSDSYDCIECSETD